MKLKRRKNHQRIQQSGGLTWLASLAVVLTLAAGSIATHAAVVAHWTFDESSGPTAHDSAGLFNGNLSPNGAAFVSGGISGNAISLSKAANGFVSMGDVLGLTSGDFSIVAWVKMNPGDRTDSSVFLSKQAAYTRNGYFLNVNKTGGQLVDDKAAFYEGGTGVAPITIAETPISTTSVNDGNWHQVVAVYQAGGNKSIYVDGAPAEDVKPSQPFVGNSVAFLIGGVNYSGVPTGLFTGLIDDVQIYNHALSGGDVDFLFQHPGQTSPACVAAPAGLVSWWQAESNALDSADGNNGVLINGATFAAGKVGQAFSFDGVDDYVSFGNTAGNFGTSDFTIEFWIQTTSTRFQEGVLEKWAACGFSSFFSIRIGGPTTGVGKLHVEMAQDGAGNNHAFLESTKAVNDGIFHHAAWVRQGINLFFYVDGVLDVSGSSPGITSINNNANLLAGSDPCIGIDGTLPFTGQLDEISMYNRALSATEIQAIYNADGAGKCVPTPPLDCSQQLAAVQAQLAAANAANAALQAQLAAANQTIQDLQNEILALVLPLQLLTQDFRTTFNDAQFQIPGATAAEQMQNLVGEILDLPQGQQQKLFINLGGQKNRR